MGKITVNTFSEEVQILLILLAVDLFYFSRVLVHLQREAWLVYSFPRRFFMNQKSLMVLHQAKERLDRFVFLGATHNLVLIHDASDALSFLKRIPVDVVLLREQMSGMDAMEFLMNLQDLHLSVSTIVLTHDRFPTDFPEMTNVYFLKESVSPDELNKFISQLETFTQQTYKVY
jgi:CheY-like chemotaxis protein